jgi:hypothetical protein
VLRTKLASTCGSGRRGTPAEALSRPRRCPPLGAYRSWLQRVPPRSRGRDRDPPASVTDRWSTPSCVADRGAARLGEGDDDDAVRFDGPDLWAVASRGGCSRRTRSRPPQPRWAPAGVSLRVNRCRAEAADVGRASQPASSRHGAFHLTCCASSRVSRRASGHRGAGSPCRTRPRRWSGRRRGAGDGAGRLRGPGGKPRAGARRGRRARGRRGRRPPARGLVAATARRLGAPVLVLAQTRDRAAPAFTRLADALCSARRRLWRPGAAAAPRKQDLAETARLQVAILTAPPGCSAWGRLVYRSARSRGQRPKPPSGRS